VTEPHDLHQLLERAADEVPSGRPDARQIVAHRVRRHRTLTGGIIAAVVLLAAVTVLRIEAQLRPGAVIRFADRPQQQAPALDETDRDSSAVSNSTKGYLPDGTPFVLQGPGAAALEPDGIGVTLMVRDGQEARPLGVFSSTKWDPEDTDKQRDRQPTQWENGRIVARHPPWSFTIDVYDDVLADATASTRERIRSSITGSVRSGYLVLSVDPPVRFARADDGLPQAAEVTYSNGVVVVSGCSEQSEADAVCSPDKRVSLQSGDGVDPHEWSITAP
jgi:hypothetical protein